SPQYYQQRQPLESPADLYDHPILQVYPSGSDWHVWLEAHAPVGVVPESGLQFESYDVALSSAVQGMGVALGQQPYVTREFAEGSLMELFPGKRVRNPNQWYLATRREKMDIPKIRVFRDWLLEQIEADAVLRDLRV
ncbi:MAG: LysR substrate-binding domain-containing protein, partial [Proteobacteria bacterium]|nr:LysR substrate-binding domain-containing protein [Pseudomonadota bacterium]